MKKAIIFSLAMASLAMTQTIAQTTPEWPETGRETLARFGAEEGEHRCEYTGPTGIQCRNMARPGSRFCGIHEKLAQYADSTVSDDPDSLI